MKRSDMKSARAPVRVEGPGPAPANRIIYIMEPTVTTNDTIGLINFTNLTNKSTRDASAIQSLELEIAVMASASRQIAQMLGTEAAGSLARRSGPRKQSSFASARRPP